MKTIESKNYIYCLSIQYNGSWKKVAFKDILYLNSSGNYTEIHIRNVGKPYYTLKSLEQYERELPSVFFRCHRSSIVNMVYIQHITQNEIGLMNEARLPLSKARKRLLEEKLANLPALTVPYCNHCGHCPDREDCRTILPFVLGHEDAAPTE